MADNNEQLTPQQTVVVVQTPSSPVMGILSIVFSVLGIFFLAIIFAPLGLILGIISLFKKQVLLGVIGIILALVAIWLSPTFWAMFGASTLAIAH